MGCPGPSTSKGTREIRKKRKHDDLEDPIDEVRSDEETSSSDEELEDCGDSESCGEDRDEADGNSDDDDDDTTRSQSHPRGSATGASSKDQAGDKQGNKDDHGDGGANDGDNNPKESIKDYPAVTQSGSAAGDSCKDDDGANTQKESNKAEPAGFAAGDSCKDDDGANTQKESSKAEPAGTQSDPVEPSSEKDEVADKSQGTPPSTQSGTQSDSDFSGLSPITPANQHGLLGSMTLLDLMKTPTIGLDENTS
ncbi:protein starmaker-like [Panicum virgatum]|uniref:protein starmaker-like n=1 Tax=Panicum virgatum TaxID=38727 RepID=UPI0019D5284B|nr:protein starmaker-like [Panicum virgatum]